MNPTNTSQDARLGYSYIDYVNGWPVARFAPYHLPSCNNSQSNYRVQSNKQKQWTSFPEKLHLEPPGPDGYVQLDSLSASQPFLRVEAHDCCGDDFSHLGGYLGLSVICAVVDIFILNNIIWIMLGIRV